MWAPPGTARNSLWLWGPTLRCAQTSLASIPGFSERSLCIEHQFRTTGHCRSWQPLGVPPRVFSEGSWVGCKCGLFLFSIFADSPLGTCGSYLHLDFMAAVIIAILYDYIIITLPMHCILIQSLLCVPQTLFSETGVKAVELSLVLTSQAHTLKDSK